MKSKFIYGTLIIFFITLTILIYIKDNKDLIIISSDQIFSIYHSDDNEKFTVEILTTDPNNYYFDLDYINTASFKTPDEELSITIKEVIISNNRIEYLDNEYYAISFKCGLPFVSNDLAIEYEDVSMEITYNNGESIMFHIGEFNYLFKEEIHTDIALNNLSATYQEIEGINTVGGINLSLGNLSAYNINIIGIDLFSSSVHTNEKYIVERDECDMTNSVADCIYQDFYAFQYKEPQEIKLLLRKNNSIELYIPLTYTNNATFIHRFSLIVTYEINNEEKQMIIDDFPFMSTSIFNDSVKEDFNVYTISDRSE